MNILVTGANGFVGHNLAEHFSDGGFNVFRPGRAELNLTDSESVERFFNANDIGAILHCATARKDGMDYPPNTCEVNLRMFFNLEKYKKKTAKLVNLGSGSEYSRAYWKRKMKEEYFGEHIPADGHSYAKCIISKYIEETAREDLVCLRIFGIYGKYEDYRSKFISNAIVKNILKMPIVINQNVIFDYMYIKDFSRIMEYFVKNNTAGKVFNATPNETIDLVRLAEIVNKAGGFKSELKVLNPGIGIEYSGDNSKLLKEIGEFRFTSHEASIKELYRYYESIKDQLDVKAIEQDSYLKYAKMLKRSYFRSGQK